MAQPAQTPSPQATQTEVGHEAGGHANFPPFASETFPSQLLWLAISFGALYVFMAKVFLPKVGAAIQERKERLGKDLDDADRDAAARGRRRRRAPEGAGRGARQGASAGPGGARSSGRRIRGQAQALNEELAAKFAAAESQIAARRDQAMSSVDDIARDAAGAIVERLIGRPAKAEAIADAVDFLQAKRAESP